MIRRIGAGGVLFWFAFSVACEIDSRNFDAVDPSALPSGGAVSTGDLRVQPGSVAYGPIAVGFVASARLLVENTGTTPLSAPGVSIDGEGTSAFSIRQNDCSAELAPGGHCGIALGFLPSDRRARQATLTLASSGENVEIPLFGSGLEPGALLLQAAPSSDVLFGDVPLHAEKEATLRLGNSKSLDSGIVQLISNDAAFSLVPAQGNECPSELRLPSGQACDFRVRFAPTLRGVTDATITARSQNMGSVSLGVSGRSVEPSGAGVPRGDLFVAAAEGSSIDFGSVVLGSEKQQVFRVSNTASQASGPLTLAINSDEFSIAAPSGAECASGVTDLGAGTSCDVRVSFVPARRLQRNATLTVSSAAGGSALNLSGVGLEAAVLQAEGPLDFGETAQGNTTTRSLTVTNSGDEGVTAVSIRFSGPDAASFAVQRNGCAAGLAPLGSCLISIFFSPVTLGSHLATLGLLSQRGGTRDVALSGVGIAPAVLSVDPSAIIFDPPTPVGQSVRAALSVRNRGEAATGYISASIVPSTSAFAVTLGTCAAGLASAESCELEVSFTPTSSGPHDSNVSLTTPQGGRVDIPISGTGAAPATLELLATEGADFGGVGLNAERTRSFAVQSAGDLPAGALVAITLGPGFSLAPPLGNECRPGVTALGARASCDFRVTLRPTALGNVAVTMLATSESGASSSLVLTGVGLPPPVLGSSAPRLAFANAVTAFAQGSETLTWTVRNTGGTSSDPLLLSNTNQREFPHLGNCVQALAPGDACSVQIQLAPTGVGLRMAVLTLAAGNLSTSVTLTGVGQ